jgi:hypothetical protein
MVDAAVDDSAVALLHRLSLALPRANVDADTEMSFEALPVDVVVRILSLATSHIRGHDAWRITSRAACVSQGMRSAADLCWQSHAMSLFPLGALPTDAPKHWLGFRAPHSWRDCVREVATALPMPTWTKFPCAAEEKKEEWAPAPASANHPFGPHGGAIIRDMTAAPPEDTSPICAESRQRSCIRSSLSGGPFTFFGSGVFNNCFTAFCLATCCCSSAHVRRPPGLICLNPGVF